VFRIRIRIRMFLGLPDPHPVPLATNTDPAPFPSSIKNSNKNLDFYRFVTFFRTIVQRRQSFSKHELCKCLESGDIREMEFFSIFRSREKNDGLSCKVRNSMISSNLYYT
jgi:hypothetical protein